MLLEPPDDFIFSTIFYANLSQHTSAMLNTIKNTANPLKNDLRSHTKCVLICWVATLSTFQYGLDNTVVGGFLSMPGFLHIFGYKNVNLHRYNIDPVVQQLISSLMVLGVFISSLLVGPWSEFFGRKRGLQAATLANFIATAIQIGSESKAALYVARLILGNVDCIKLQTISNSQTGFSIGWFLVFAQLYMHECVPAHLRGVSFALYQFMLNLGLIIGAAVDYGTKGMGGKESYRIPLALFFVAPTIQFITMFFAAPESPRWLMVQGREAQAEAALRRLRNSEIVEAEFQAELNEIRQLTLEQVEQSKNMLWTSMWQGTNRRRTFLCIATICMHAGNGR